MCSVKDGGHRDTNEDSRYNLNRTGIRMVHEPNH